jgi:alanyl-tRNA synthetase
VNLQSALKTVLGNEVAQAGSLVQADRLRFDFNSPKGMTAAEITEVERLVNLWIGEGHPVNTTSMDLDEAKGNGEFVVNWCEFVVN